MSFMIVAARMAAFSMDNSLIIRGRNDLASLQKLIGILFV